MNTLSNIIMLFGAIVLLISSIGILRLPTFLTRIHPAAKTTTLGIIIFFTGVGVAEPSWIPRLLVAIVLFMFTSPVSASALARTALSDEEKDEFYPTGKSEHAKEEE